MLDGECTFLVLSGEAWVPIVQIPQAEKKSALGWEKTVQDSAHTESPPLYEKKITPNFPDGTLNKNENPSELYRWLIIYQAMF